MAMTRVWNITDDVNPDVKPQNLVVLGSFLKPGRFVAVDEALLVRAHKVHAAVKAGLLYIGKKPPSTYAMMKKPPRAKLADGVAKAHVPGQAKKAAPGKAPRAPAAAPPKVAEDKSSLLKKKKR